MLIRMKKKRDNLLMGELIASRKGVVLKLGAHLLLMMTSRLDPKLS
jgi:hypothetical protein